MQQEDDLRGLAKVMDFMRALSILFVVINIYWYCYQQIEAWGINVGVIDRILLNFDRTAGLFHNILWTKLLPLYFLPFPVWEQRGKRGKDHLEENYHFTLRRLYPLFFFNWWLLYLPLPMDANAGFLYPDHVGRLYLPADGRGYGCRAC